MKKSFKTGFHQRMGSRTSRMIRAMWFGSRKSVCGRWIVRTEKERKMPRTDDLPPIIGLCERGNRRLCPVLSIFLRSQA